MVLGVAGVIAVLRRDRGRLLPRLGPGAVRVAAAGQGHPQVT